MIPSRFWNSAITAVILLTVFLAVVSIKELKSIGYVGANPNQTNTITVDGTGNAIAIPDVATFSFGVTENAKTVADAQTQATDKINAALKTVRDAGVADKDIQTTEYTINPHYEYQSAVCPVSQVMTPAVPGVAGVSGSAAIYCPSGRQVLTGYDVNETTQVKVRDLSKAGALFTAIGALGVQNIGNLTFAVDDPDAVNAQARTNAITDAKTKAQALASQLGVTLVSITNFYDQGNGPRPVVYNMAASMGAAVPSAASVSPEIPTGQNKITDTVSITYEIR